MLHCPEKINKKEELPWWEGRWSLLRLWLIVRKTHQCLFRVRQSGRQRGHANKVLLIRMIDEQGMYLLLVLITSWWDETQHICCHAHIRQRERECVCVVWFWKCVRIRMCVFVGLYLFIFVCSCQDTHRKKRHNNRHTKQETWHQINLLLSFTLSVCFRHVSLSFSSLSLLPSLSHLPLWRY